MPGKYLRFGSLALFFLTGLLSARVLAQTNIPEHAHPLLQRLEAELLFPLDGGYKPMPLPGKNAFQPVHFQLYSREEGLQIRFFLQPDTSSRLNPHLESRRLALHLCSNDENAIITARDLTTLEQESLFQSDWGKVHLFPPKPEFGDGAPFCQMLSIYKEGRGMIHIFILFQEPSPIVENRLYLARFL